MREETKKKIMIVFGTRPEATKMGTVIQELKKYPHWFEIVVVATGQHKEQLFKALNAFNLQPDINLDIMKVQQTPSYVTSTVIKDLDEVFAKEKPDLVLVHGDTQTTVSAALAATYSKIPVAHVEAGLRSFNKTSPWPEEINRCIIDVIASVFLAPTSVNKENLLREGINLDCIYVTGQTQIDSAMAMYKPEYCFQETKLNNIDYSKRLVVVTAHRRENYGEPMKQMFRAMLRTVNDHPDIIMIYPVHLSPIVQETAKCILSNHERIILLDPIDYRDMINLISRAYLVMSDSGGLQEECPVFHKPLVLMRDTTERPEGVESGVTILCGTTEETIYEETHRLLTDEDEYTRRANAKNPFGDGKASERIVYALAHYFGFVQAPLMEFLP
jgi:UDP-N-acetylglucosamine 2-epimerase (non-hydrolysing)